MTHLPRWFQAEASVPINKMKRVKKMENPEENRSSHSERAALKKEVRSLRAKVKRRNAKVGDLEARLSVTRGLCLRITSFNREIRAFLDTVFPPSSPPIEGPASEEDHSSPVEAEIINQTYAETAITEWEEVLREGGEGPADPQMDPQK